MVRDFSEPVNDELYSKLLRVRKKISPQFRNGIDKNIYSILNREMNKVKYKSLLNISEETLTTYFENKEEKIFREKERQEHLERRRIQVQIDYQIPEVDISGHGRFL